MNGPIRLSEREAKVLKDRVRCAVKFRERTWDKRAERARKLYDGQHWPDMKRASKRSRIVVNHVRPAVDTKVANIAFAYPEFTLKPMNAEGRDHADTASQVIRFDWRRAGAQKEAKRALRDNQIYGLGICFDGWLWETEPTGMEPGQRSECGRGNVAGEPPDTTENPGYYEEPPVTQEMLREDRPLVKRIAPCHFFVDPECDAVLANARFCGYCEYRPLAEVKADERLKNVRQIEGSAKSMRPWVDGEYTEMEDEALPQDLKRVKLLHYYERARKIHAIFCEEHDKPLFVEPWTWSGDWYPFVVLRAPDSEDEFWPTPPPLWIEHQQSEINEARTQHSEWRRQSAPGYQTAGTLDEAQKQTISSGMAGRVVEGVMQPLAPIPHAPIAKEVLEAGTIALNDLQFVFGLNEYETATVPSKRMTQAEVEAVRSSGGSRSAAERQAFEMFCAEIAEHMLAWEQQYSVRTRSLPIFDKNDKVLGFRDYTKEEIAGQYLVEVYVGSTTAPSSQEMLNGVGLFMQSLPNFVQGAQAAQMIGLDLKPLLMQFLKAIPAVRDVEELMMAGPGGPEQMMGQAPLGLDGMPPPEQEMGGEDPMAMLAALRASGEMEF